ncbi:hypothetical protein BR93DRAFT_298520 [Coniochaeta sp. PMI_546]|nr:hypothetical protein BR93DRAFT_298520 [Coniochaeta sp. PMI_546]
MSSRKPETEILVHITAPSKATDDASYRTLATAYLSFEPVARTTVGSFTHSTAHVEDTRDLPSIPPPPPPPPPPQPPVLRPESDPVPSPILSFGSVAHNLNSPGLQRAPTSNAGESDESQSSWRAPPSVVQDSNPDNNISIARYCSPTRILEHYLQGFDSSESNATQSVPTEPVSSPTTREVTTSLQLPTAGRAFAVPPQPPNNVASSSLVIPQTPLPSIRKRSAPPDLSNATSEVAAVSTPTCSQQTSRAIPAEDAPRSGVQGVIPSTETDTVIAASFPASTADLEPPSRADSEPLPPLKRQKRVFTGLATNALSRSSSDIGPRQTQVKTSQLFRRQRVHQSLDGLEIHSPNPTVSCEDLDVRHVVTRGLEKLAGDLDINKRFQPKHQVRGLRPFERGHWAVDCSAWPDSVKQDTWAFLTNYIGNGVAGWGVWCRRDNDFTWIRLYCWGCVVGHMHLLLYLASRRHLNYTATIWVGGDGEALITMAPKYGQ